MVDENNNEKQIGWYHTKIDEVVAELAEMKENLF